MHKLINKLPNIHVIIDYFIRLIYKFHTKILSLNDKYEASFSDKELHFLVIGILGFGLLLGTYGLFKYLEKRKLTIISAWITVLIFLVSFSFAIEIAQGMSGTGDMDFKDIVAGLAGYFAFSGIVFVIAIIKSVTRKVKNKKGENNARDIK